MVIATNEQNLSVKASPFESNFLHLLCLAAEQNASDLHLDPMDGAVRVRIRVDGTLRILQWIKGSTYAGRFFQEAKKVCGFDMGLISVPQDRRLRAEVVPYDLRASLIPTLYGEKIVLRLLQRGKQFSLETYAMPKDAKVDLRRALQRPQGLILLSGPTGGGKTTLLYSALAAINAEERNVHTLEDPVEYDLPGVMQTSISPGDMSFAGALRALMRQDPDVIMVGEIRDKETALAAVHAAATGHLVLSTIHANSARSSINRLEDFGLSYEQVSANLLFASAQRLFPRNCLACVQPDEANQHLVSNTFRDSLIPVRSVGCKVCGHTGVRGRALVFEYITFIPSPNTGNREAQPHGSLKGQAFEYLKKGVINAEHACSLE